MLDGFCVADHDDRIGQPEVLIVLVTCRSFMASSRAFALE